MLPIFPKFKKIELTDYHEIEKINNKFSPYNDFEFASLWTYNTKGGNEISTLNDNLVIKIHDFLSGDLFYSFIGNNNFQNTVEKLIIKSKDEHLGNKLFLIPEKNFSEYHTKLNHLKIKEDPDNFDYILSIDEISTLAGKKYYDKRNLVNRFLRLYPQHSIKKLDINLKENQELIINLFHQWRENKGKSHDDISIELIAINKLFEIASILKAEGLGIFIENKLVAFSIFHPVQNKYAIISFQKCDLFYKGINENLMKNVALRLKTLGCDYINYEQDLGIQGLKEAKMHWRPVFFLKKYTIEEIQN